MSHSSTPPDASGDDTRATFAQQQVVTRRLDPALTEDLDQHAIQHSANPWLLLHRGRCLCRLHSDFDHARPFVDAALTTFRQRGDNEGMIWALVEWVVLCYHFREYLNGINALQAVDAAGWRPYLRAELLFGRFLCLIGRDQLADAADAGHAALAALDAEDDRWLQRIGRIQMLRNQAAAYHYLGEERRAVAATETALQLAREDPDTADSEPWCCYELGLAYWRKGNFAEAAAMLDCARRLAETWRHRELWRWAVATQGHLLRDQGQLAEARAAYQLADSWGEDVHGPVFLFIREGRLAEARWACEALLTLAHQLESPIYATDAAVLRGLVDLQAGRSEEALRRFTEAASRYESLSYRYNLASTRFYQASALIDLGRFEEADAALAQGLTFAATEEVYTCDWWMPELLEQLLLRATQRRIEPQHAQRILDRRFLSMPPTMLKITERQNLKQELEIARQTQLNLLPSEPPFVPDLDIAGISLPAEEVGGDFYGYYPAGADPASGVDRQLGVVLGDISGKGLQSALLTSGTVVAVSTAVADRPPPAVLLTRVHTALLPYTTRSHLNVALCYAVLTQGRQRWSLRAANAGAFPPLLRRHDGSIEWLDVAGLPLGATQLGRYREASTSLAPGDIVMLLSDGVVEAMDRERELFGFDRLEQAFANAPLDGGARGVMLHLLTAVQTHATNTPQHDDITLVIVRIQAAAPDMRSS